MLRPFALCFLIFVVTAPALAGLAPGGPARAHLEEAVKDRPNEPTRFGGTVHWSNDTIRRADGSPEVVARADVTIPERRLKISLLFQNDTGTGPLGQTIQISFDVPADFAGGKGIRELQELRMREAESSIGIPYGRAVQKIRDGVFLIGVARDVLTAEASFNRRDWDWITLSLVYGDDQRAQLVVGKGHDGQQAITAMNEQNEKLKLTPSAETAPKPAVERKPEPPKPVSKAERTFDVNVLRALLEKRDPTVSAATRRLFQESLDRITEKLAQCWRPDKTFKGTLRYRVALEKDGKIAKMIPFADNRNDNGIDRIATAALQSCQPYAIPASYRSSNFFEVVLTQGVEIVSLADIPPEQGKPLPAAVRLANDPSNLASSEREKLAAQVRKCVPTLEPGSMAEIDLRLNVDGSVAPTSKVVSSTTPGLGQRLLQATFQCQPYLLPAEKYDAWKAIVLDFGHGS
jgi:hypothetical protein